MKSRCSRLRRRDSRGFTRADLAVVFGLIALVTVVALPSLHYARETAAGNSCAVRLGKLGKAVDDYETTNGFYPDAWYHPQDVNGSTTYHGFCTKLLPHLGEAELAKKYQWDKPWWAAENQEVVNTRVEVFECPTSPVEHVRKGLKAVGSAAEFPDRTMAIGDFIILRGYYDYASSPPPVDARVMGMLMGLSDPGPRDMAVDVRPRREMVTDGLAHTAMIGERCGRPGYWVQGKKVSDTNTLFGFDGGWASYQSVWPRTFEDDGKAIATQGVGPKTINCNNGFGVYSFHPGGANVVFGDGAVHFLNEKISSDVFLALLSRQRGEVLDSGDYDSRER